MPHVARYFSQRAYDSSFEPNLKKSKLDYSALCKKKDSEDFISLQSERGSPSEISEPKFYGSHKGKRDAPRATEDFLKLGDGAKPGLSKNYPPGAQSRRESKSDYAAVCKKGNTEGYISLEAPPERESSLGFSETTYYRSDKDEKTRGGEDFLNGSSSQKKQRSSSNYSFEGYGRRESKPSYSASCKKTETEEYISLDTESESSPGLSESGHYESDEGEIDKPRVSEDCLNGPHNESKSCKNYSSEARSSTREDRNKKQQIVELSKADKWKNNRSDAEFSETSTAFIGPLYPPPPKVESVTRPTCNENSKSPSLRISAVVSDKGANKIKGEDGINDELQQFYKELHELEAEADDHNIAETTANSQQHFSSLLSNAPTVHQVRDPPGQQSSSQPCNTLPRKPSALIPPSYPNESTVSPAECPTLPPINKHDFYDRPSPFDKNNCFVSLTLPPHGFECPPPQGAGYHRPPPPPQGVGPQGFGYPPPPGIGPQGFGFPPPQGVGCPPPQGFGPHGSGYPPPQGVGPQGFGFPPLQGFGCPPPQGVGPQGFGCPPPWGAGPQGFECPPPRGVGCRPTQGAGPQGFECPPPRGVGSPPPQGAGPQGFECPPRGVGCRPTQAARPQDFECPPPRGVGSPPQGFGCPSLRGVGSPPPRGAGPQGFECPPPRGSGCPPPQGAGPQDFECPPPPRGVGCRPTQGAGPQGFECPPPRGDGSPPPQGFGCPSPLRGVGSPPLQGAGPKGFGCRPPRGSGFPPPKGVGTQGFGCSSPPRGLGPQGVGCPSPPRGVRCPPRGVDCSPPPRGFGYHPPEGVGFPRPQDVELQDFGCAPPEDFQGHPLGFQRPPPSTLPPRHNNPLIFPRGDNIHNLSYHENERDHIVNDDHPQSTRQTPWHSTHVSHESRFCPERRGHTEPFPRPLVESTRQAYQQEGFCEQESRHFNQIRLQGDHLPHEQYPSRFRDEAKCTDLKRKLVMLRGVPGSGKSTLARILLDRSPDGIVLSTDDYFCQEKGYTYDVTLLGDAHSWNQDRARRAMDDGRSPIIIDNTNIQGWEMKPYVQMAIESGYSVEFLEPNTWWKLDPHELERRNTHRVPREKISQMLDRFEHDMNVGIVMNSLEPRRVRSRGPPETRQR